MNDTWRFAYIETRARGFGPDAWLRTNQVVNLEPGDDERQASRQVAREMGRKPEDVRLVVWDQ